MVVFGYVVDMVLEGPLSARMAYVISNKHAEIAMRPDGHHHHPRPRDGLRVLQPAECRVARGVRAAERLRRSPPTYYRGCWHVVSRDFLLWYRHYLSIGQSFTKRIPSSLTRRRCIRVPPIVQNSPLLPPVGVWTVSQFQCGRSLSQAGYRSSPW